ncbi:hypothetical protein GNY06_02785 [Elizabethkingia argentiflava]|uniref:Uncharacterized protein n=1 Tax=Elizabethkingia argenteiflava TaxID=2681556 RepID=A0A845PPW3_9FLAO|nr:hypothetical protein [Elizabethkingia argenteiflava]
MGTGATFAQVTNSQTGKNKSDTPASSNETSQDKLKKSSEAGLSPRVKKEDGQSATHPEKGEARQRRTYDRDRRHEQM